jgi:archaellum component FlaC
MDYLNSFFQNIKDKLSNPFFGTLILILIIHHWELWYSLFNFDKNYTRNAKVSLIRNLAEYELSTTNIITDILYALLISLCGYLIVVGTRTLSMLIEFRIMPFITGKIINKNVVLKSTHDETVLERDEYSEKYEEQRKNVRLLSKNYDDQTEQIKNKDEALAQSMESISKLTQDLNTSEHKLQNTKNELQTSQNTVEHLESETKKQIANLTMTMNDLSEFRSLFFYDENRPFWNSPYKFPDVIINKVRELKKANKWEQFLKVASFIEGGGTMSQTMINEIIEFGLIEKGEETNFKRLKPIGEIIFRYRSIFDQTETVYNIH